jgi:hypothetical protein
VKIAESLDPKMDIAVQSGTSSDCSISSSSSGDDRDDEEEHKRTAVMNRIKPIAKRLSRWIPQSEHQSGNQNGSPTVAANSSNQLITACASSVQQPSIPTQKLGIVEAQALINRFEEFAAKHGLKYSLICKYYQVLLSRLITIILIEFFLKFTLCLS